MLSRAWRVCRSTRGLDVRSNIDGTNRSEVERFAARLEVLSFDHAAADHAADIRAALERAGQVIGAYDLWIAGHAPSRGLIVVTENLEEFSRVDGLRSEDWM